MWPSQSLRAVGARDQPSSSQSEGGASYQDPQPPRSPVAAAREPLKLPGPRVTTEKDISRRGRAARAAGTMRTTRRKQSAPLCISSNEMERLRSFTRPPPKKEEDLRNEHLKKLSEDRVKNWPNTLAAQRKKKEQWKEIRAAEEEAYRVKVDNEERELREAAAAKAYAKAKYLKFENQDKTKCGRGVP